jgi:hypothetical protein
MDTPEAERIAPVSAHGGIAASSESPAGAPKSLPYRVAQLAFGEAEPGVG